MQWKIPPRIKIYEALGCLADGRMTVSGNEAKVFPSSRDKFYTVRYDPARNAIMANDNGSYWQGYLGYPAIVLLFQKNVIPRAPESADALKDIHRKDLNTKFQNDFAKTEAHVLQLVRERGYDADALMADVEAIHAAITKLRPALLGKRMKPPKGY